MSQTKPGTAVKGALAGVQRRFPYDGLFLNDYKKCAGHYFFSLKTC